MKTIRANKIFALVKEQGQERIAHVRIPQRRGPYVEDGSAKLIETFLLIALLKITQAKKVFEFGTYLGSTTLNLALNSDATIYTLDLDWISAPEAQQSPYDASVTDFRLTHPKMEFEDFPELCIVQLFGDSTKKDLSVYYGQFDLAWIDGGHDFDTITADSRNALCLLKDQGGAVAWHDYAKPDFPDVTNFLDRMEKGGVPLFHIEDTSLVIYFNWPVGL